jgi:hypothetical protein
MAYDVLLRERNGNIVFAINLIHIETYPESATKLCFQYRFVQYSHPDIFLTVAACKGVHIFLCDFVYISKNLIFAIFQIR